MKSTFVHLLHEQELNIGDKDSWNLLVFDENSGICIEHRASHRNGNQGFLIGTELMSLEKVKKDMPWLYEKALKKLDSLGIAVQK